MNNYWDEMERQRVYSGFTIVPEKETKNILHYFRGLKEAINWQDELCMQENWEGTPGKTVETIKETSGKMLETVEDKDKGKRNIHKLIKHQNETYNWI